MSVSLTLVLYYPKRFTTQVECVNGTIICKNEQNFYFIHRVVIETLKIIFFFNNNIVHSHKDEF